MRRRLADEANRDQARTWGVLLLALGVALLVLVVGLFAGWFAVHNDAVELVRTATVTTLWGLSLALVFSSLGHAAQAFFSARDLWLWESAPVPAWARFTDRFVETVLSATLPTLALGSVGLVGLQLGAGSGVGAALRAVVAVVVATLSPVSLGVLLAHVGGAVLPAGRLRRLSLLLLGVGVTVVLVWFRRLRIERLLTEEGAAQMLGAVKQAGPVGPSLLPPRQLASFVIDGSVSGLLGGVVGVGLLVALAFVAHVVLYDRARKLAVDEAPSGVLPGSLTDRVLRGVLRVVAPDLRPMVHKDLLAFVRDPGQWGQVVLLVGVGVLYVVNASALGEGLRQLREAGLAFLAAMHVGIVAFIAGGLATRFAFPQVGLEGMAVWIVDGAPLRPERLLRAKWWAAAPVAVIFPTVLGIVGGVVLDFGLVRTVWTSLLIACSAVAYAGIAVGRGARQPLFDATSLSELAMGPGAISTIIQATVLAAAACFTGLVVEACRMGAQRGVLATSSAWSIAGGALVVIVAIEAACAVVAMRGGAQALLLRRVSGGAAR